MTDRVYPSAKPNGATSTANGPATNPPTFPPATKPQLYNPARHPYRPQPNNLRRRRSRRSCFCLCCFWSILLLTALLLLAAIAGCIAYLLYSPRRPAFSVTALRISQFNLSSSAADDTPRLATALNVTVSAKNPNKKLVFNFDPIAITAKVSNQVEIANGSFPSFDSPQNNVTLIRATLSTKTQLADSDSANSVRLDLKRKNGLPLKIEMDTKVVVILGKMKSKRLGIRVTCDGIRGFVPKGKSPSIASTSNAKCKVDLRIKIWKFTF